MSGGHVGSKRTRCRTNAFNVSMMVTERSTQLPLSAANCCAGTSPVQRLQACMSTCSVYMDIFYIFSLNVIRFLMWLARVQDINPWACSSLQPYFVTVEYIQECGQWIQNLISMHRVGSCKRIHSQYLLVRVQSTGGGGGGKLLPQTLELPPQMFPNCTTK